MAFVPFKWFGGLSPYEDAVQIESKNQMPALPENMG